MNGFALWSATHVAILVAIILAGGTVGLAIRFGRLPAATLGVLGAAIAASESVWYWTLATGPWRLWPALLPLHLCDLTLWLTVVAALRRSTQVFAVAYYWGIAGTGMAILTPDVQGLSWSYPTVQFFVSHGLVIITLLAMAMSRRVTIAHSTWRTAWGWLQLVALALGGFNAAFGTNYLYLREKPAGASLLDHFGPWPWYLLVADLAGALLFFLLSRPFKQERPAIR